MFDFQNAQKYELEWQKDYNVHHFNKEYENWLNLKNTQETGLHPAQFFDNNIQQFDAFLDHIKGKKLVEIGCGSFPMSRNAFNISDKSVIDPLADAYHEFQINNFGKTNFEGIRRFSQPAEIIINEFLNSVDGCIIFRNALDHSEDYLSILNVVSEYATAGCYLLFWSDIWHKKGEPEGHRNITQSHQVMDKIFNGLGFLKIISSLPIRNPEIYVEYGGVFVKK